MIPELHFLQHAIKSDRPMPGNPFNVNGSIRSTKYQRRQFIVKPPRGTDELEVAVYLESLVYHESSILGELAGAETECAHRPVAEKERYGLDARSCEEFRITAKTQRFAKAPHPVPGRTRYQGALLIYRLDSQPIQRST